MKVRTLKPTPEGIEACCSALGVRPEQTVYVGDTRWGILAATAAGARRVGVLTGLASRDELVTAGAASVIDALDELPAALGITA